MLTTLYALSFVGFGLFTLTVHASEGQEANASIPLLQIFSIGRLATNPDVIVGTGHLNAIPSQFIGMDLIFDLSLGSWKGVTASLPQSSTRTFVESGANEGDFSFVLPAVADMPKGVVEASWGVKLGVFGPFQFTGQVSIPAAITTTTTKSNKITLLTKTLRVFVVGTDYRVKLIASGVYPPFRWYLKTGRLPTGLHLSRSGLLYGVTVSAGAERIAIQVKDSHNDSAARTFVVRSTKQ
jgi:hypothetical protein